MRIRKSDISFEGGETINGFEFCRRRAAMTQVEAAAAIRVTQGTVSQWETVNTYPTGDRLRLVAEVYGCTIDELYREQSA